MHILQNNCHPIKGSYGLDIACSFLSLGKHDLSAIFVLVVQAMYNACLHILES